MSGLAGYVVRRLLLAPVILFAVSIATFALGRLAPADYVDVQAGTRATPEIKERIREDRGLNDPIYEQYVRYVSHFVQGDFGQSVIYRGAGVDEVIFPRLWVTLQYNVVILVLTFAIGAGLMLLIFYSNRAGFDDRPETRWADGEKREDARQSSAPQRAPSPNC